MTAGVRDHAVGAAGGSCVARWGPLTAWTLVEGGGWSARPQADPYPGPGCSSVEQGSVRTCTLAT